MFIKFQIPCVQIHLSFLAFFCKPIENLTGKESGTLMYQYINVSSSSRQALCRDRLASYRGRQLHISRKLVYNCIEFVYLWNSTTIRGLMHCTVSPKGHTVQLKTLWLPALGSKGTTLVDSPDKFPGWFTSLSGELNNGCNSRIITYEIRILSITATSGDTFYQFFWICNIWLLHSTITITFQKIQSSFNKLNLFFSTSNLLIELG